MQQYLAPQRLDVPLWKYQSDLVVREQPVDAALFALDAFMFTESLAPAPEVGGITLEFPVEHYES